MNNGWIKLHRKILDNPIAKNGLYAWLWVVLLLKANHKPDKFMWNGGIIEVNEGQLLTGRKALSEDSHIPESTVEDILRFLEKHGQIQQQKTNKYRLITIVKWKDHQIDQQQTDNKATTNRQHADTNKNVKNVKNDKKDTTQSVGGLGNEVIYLFREVNPSYESLFRRAPQHRAAERLIETHGLERVKKVVEFLSMRRGDRYCPTITSPTQLEDKWAALEKYAVGLKANVKNQNVIW